tara:strand:- start:2968 stop:3093 length:126 start_codon:yes stop_codon:yes gene_type:complete
MKTDNITLLFTIVGIVVLYVLKQRQQRKDLERMNKVSRGWK